MCSQNGRTKQFVQQEKHKCLDPSEMQGDSLLRLKCHVSALHSLPLGILSGGELPTQKQKSYRLGSDPNQDLLSACFYVCGVNEKGELVAVI